MGKKILAIVITLTMLPTILAGCGTVAATEAATTVKPIKLIVFAASTMTETLTKIADKYKIVAPNVSITFSFDSSGTLKTQIVEGADCDLFISAAQKQMNALDITSDKNTDKLDYVQSDTRINLVVNKIVLAVPEGNPAKVKNFDDIASDVVSLVALGNSDTPVGQYSQEIFSNMGVWEKIQKKVTFGSNVKEVTTQVKAASVDCGVIFATDAKSAGLTFVAEASSGVLKTSVLYPAAVMKSSKNSEAGQAFLKFMQTAECRKIFADAGFALPN